MTEEEAMDSEEWMGEDPMDSGSPMDVEGWIEVRRRRDKINGQSSCVRSAESRDILR